nr:MAG TPA: pentapeptide repeat protein [Caudoviricetes sp.]
MEQNKVFEEAAVQEAVRGYKVFNPDWTCRHFQYEVGKVFEEDVEPLCCDRGFHFCLKAADCFNYYSFNSNNKVAEVVALGAVDYSEDNSKACTNKIQIVREIPWQELLTIVNTGKDCTGLCNTGNCNTGNCNTGNCNTGDRNTGDRNTGDWNSCNQSTGCFCTVQQPIMFFNKPSTWSFEDWLRSDARYLMNQIPKKVVEWVYSEDMTDEEKSAHPSHETTGGYLKVLDESECGQIWWDGLSEHNRNIIRALPNFDPDIFEQVTGIKILPDDVKE